MLSTSHPAPETPSRTAVMHVEGREQLMAAIKAAAQPTYELAKQNPTRIEMVDTVTTYDFPSGITERRARQILGKIRSTPKGAWK